MIQGMCIYSNLSLLVAETTSIRFYKFLEDAYSHANRTLLELLLKNQQLVPRLRSLKRFFFLSQSFFITHFLDLSHTELRKPSKSASVVKLQSLLELALNTDAHGEDILFREDVKITLADTGLYEFLMKVVSVTGGAPGGEDAGDGEANGIRGQHGHSHGHDEHKKEKEDKKTLTGRFTCLSTG